MTKPLRLFLVCLSVSMAMLLSLLSSDCQKIDKKNILYNTTGCMAVSHNSMAYVFEALKSDYNITGLVNECVKYTENTKLIRWTWRGYLGLNTTYDAVSSWQPCGSRFIHHTKVGQKEIDERLKKKTYLYCKQVRSIKLSKVIGLLAALSINANGQYNLWYYITDLDLKLNSPLSSCTETITILDKVCNYNAQSNDYSVIKPIIQE